MIDITEKKTMLRIAKAQGKIILTRETIQKILEKDIKKGDVLEGAKLAGLNAVKQTQLLIPYCHQIPIESAKFNFEFSDNSIICSCEVKTTFKTGVEMEALVGVSIALNTIWDMVKYLEKDESGQYPNTSIENIKVVKKVKG